MKERQNIRKLIEEVTDIKSWFIMSTMYISSCFASDFSQVKIKLFFFQQSHNLNIFAFI